MLLLPEEKMVEAWEPTKKQFSLGNLGAFGRQALSLLVEVAPSSCIM
jgi:hypothetical protein